MVIMGSDPIRGVLVNRGPRSEADNARAAFLTRYRNPNTRHGYAMSLDQWFAFCETPCGIDPLDAKREHIELWARVHEQRGCKPATVCTKLNALAGFYKYAVIDDRLEKNPMLNVDRPKVSYRSSTNALTRTELADFLDAARASGRPQHYALLCLLSLNGFRIGEALQVEVDSVFMQQGYYMITVVRKGGNEDTQELCNRTAHALELAVAGRVQGPMFTKKNGQRMDRRDAGRFIERIRTQVGIVRHLSPHSFRHTHVTLCLDTGVSPRDIMDSTGHRSADMIPYYDHRRHAPGRAATHLLTAYIAGAA